MKIQAVSPISGASSAGSNSGQTTTLERQIMELQKQMATVKDSKQDAKTKAEKIKELQAQISEL